MRRYDAVVSKLLFLLILGGVLTFAFLYQPKHPQSRTERLRWRIRVIGYAFVASILIPGVLRLGRLRGWW
jgi:hypothetical protein